MRDETSPKWTIQTGDGALLPEELRAFVDAWLEEAGGDPLRALVFAAQDAATLTTDRGLGDRFELAAQAAKSPKRVAAILLSEITMRLRGAGIEFEQSPVTLDGIVVAADLAEAHFVGDQLGSSFLDRPLELCRFRGENLFVGNCHYLTCPFSITLWC